MAKSFGKLLRESRKAANKTMGDVARVIGLSVAYVSDVELGNRSPFTSSRITQIATFLGVDARPLLVAAAASRGAFELDNQPDRPLAQEFAATLARGWPELSDDEIVEMQAKLADIIKRRPGQ